ncbi:MAG: MotA/TolQ/ExbB proton channel family protein [Planctomycetes bacterium]|nr:MotA/TolQ/ExbB proton channel family protein [Planctomycetota bacterium]
MDFTTVLGLLLTLGMVFLGLVAKLTDLDQIGQFLDLGSLLVVLGGSAGSALMSMPARSALQAGSALRVAFQERRRDLAALVRSVVDLSETARRDGILALELLIPQLEEAYLARGLQLAVDGADPEAVAATLRDELEQTRERHASGKAFLELLARYAPAYGMLGTVIGLILMLSPAHAGRAGEAAAAGETVILHGMALALVTTFYGVLLANAVALPLADKLAEKDREESLRMQVVLSGIRAIQSGDNPRVVEEKLAVFLPPAERSDAALPSL